MNTEFTAIIKQVGESWIGWIEEIPGVNCQERTREDLIETLRLTLKETLELHTPQGTVTFHDGFKTDG